MNDHTQGTQTSQAMPPISEDDLLALVAGSLSEAEFERVSLAVASNPVLQKQLDTLELLRSRLSLPLEPVYSEAENSAAAQKLLDKMQLPPESHPAPSPKFVPTPHAGGKPWKPPKRMRWFYGAFAAQTLCLVWLAAGLLPSLQHKGESITDEPAQYRSVGAPAGYVQLVVNFAPDTAEKSIRGLLLSIDANIISGPNQLGEYRISVAGNVADAALKKLQASNMVENVKEIKP